jgi:hypothetical protein
LVARFTKRFILWLALSLPVGAFAAGTSSAYLGEDASLDRLTSAMNGVLAGLGIALVGAWMAAATTTLAHGRLKAAGGSELLTGGIVSYGTIAISLLLLFLFE